MASRFPTSSEGKSKPRETRRGRRDDLRPSSTRTALNSRFSVETSLRDDQVTRGRGNTRCRPRQTATPQHSINCVALLKELQSTDSHDVISRLHDAKNALGTFLGKKLGDEKMQVLMHSLNNVCGSDEMLKKTEEIVSLLHEKRFLEVNVTPWIADWKTRCPANDRLVRNIESVVLVLGRMLRQIPDSVSSVGATLLVLKTIIKELEERFDEKSPKVSSSLKSLIEEHEKFQRESYELTSRKKKQRSPPEDFRCLPILPMQHELQEHFKPFLRANVVNGSYDSVHHYLDVHFRLLREDLIQPLREGISEYRNALAQRKDGSKRMPRLQNISVYENVIVNEIPDSPDDIEFSLHFEIKGKLERVDWTQSKRLKGGSLLCLSPNDFQTLIFGTIKKRDPKFLKKGFIEVTIPEMPIELLECSLTMVESPSYFEAYKHVLQRLQEIDQDKFPLMTYLVSVSTEGKLPKYVTDNPQMTFDAACICNGIIEKKRQKTSQGMHKINLIEDSEWPTKEQLGFDSSQMDAYKAALKEEVCIIQGPPPGTGKTFLGLKIVKTLLANKTNWSKGEPLLVVCYTNHALDQFLEGILNFEGGVVRLGGRSSSEKVKAKNIDLLLNRNTREAIRKLFRSNGPKEKTPEMRECEETIQTCANYKLLSLPSLEQVMDRSHRQSLVLGNIQSNSNCILFWLFNCDEIYHLHSKSKATFYLKKNDFSGYADCHDNGQDSYFFDIDGNGYADGSDNNNIKGSDCISKGDDNDYDEDDLDQKNENGNSRMNDKFKGHSNSVQLFIHEREFSEDKIPGYERISEGQTISQFIQKKLQHDDAMSKEQARMITDLWALEVHQRWRLYMFWRNSFILRKQKYLEGLSEELERREAKKKERKKKEMKKEIKKALREFSVIGATTTGAAKHSGLIQVLAPPIVIVEEAAEILEAHVVTALSLNCQHLILIGDHQQLRPSPEVYKLCKHYKLDVSLFERLVNNGMPFHRLSTQHRMKPEISRLLKIHEDFYPGLIDHDMVTHYEDIRGVDNSMYFIHHTYTEEHNDDNKSRSNLHEANFLYALYKYFLQQGYASSHITILTAYRGQVRSFKNIMGERFLEVRVCPIDNFQGEENDIILFSFVRSNEEGSIGFLKVSNRICVALSRARKGLYCIGNFHLMSQQNTLWKTIVEDLQARQCIGTQLKLVCRNHPGTVTKVSTAEDFQNVPDGGCLEKCDARLSCGHTCPKRCHPEDREHLKAFCRKPCEKVMCELQHVCPLKCGEDCGNECNEIIEHICPNLHKRRAKCHLKSCLVRCEKLLPCGHQCKNKCSQSCTEQCEVLVPKVLPCGHERMVRCYLNPKEVKCRAKCDKELQCGHSCKEKCMDPCTKKCNEIIQTIFPCGHEQTFACFLDPKEVHCQTKCDRWLDCGHPCNETCSSPCTATCQAMVQKHLPCGHLQLTKCHTDETKVACLSNCVKTLPCGHACKEKCSEACTTKCKEIVTKSLSCGHKSKMECHLQPRCPVMVLKTFDDCGHVVRVQCWREDCPKPCATRLICGHICKGTCGECKNGTLHIKCRELCEKRCMHSRCPNPCGDVCVPCAEPCPWQCQHSHCGSKCGEECNRYPCNRPCRKRLMCRHQCVGFCGEPCPPLCRVCNRSWISWLLGRKDKPHTRFIYLLDCRHVIEQKEMDKLMKNVPCRGGSIKFPECPWCKTPIRFNPRYQNKLRNIWKNLETMKGQTDGHHTNRTNRSNRANRTNRRNRTNRSNTTNRSNMTNRRARQRSSTARR